MRDGVVFNTPSTSKKITAGSDDGAPSIVVFLVHTAVGDIDSGHRCVLFRYVGMPWYIDVSDVAAVCRYSIRREVGWP